MLKRYKHKRASDFKIGLEDVYYSKSMIVTRSGFPLDCSLTKQGGGIASGVEKKIP